MRRANLAPILTPIVSPLDPGSGPLPRSDNRTADPHRDALCPVLDACGGCPSMRRSADAQRRDYESLVRAALTRQTLRSPERWNFVECSPPTAYRNRIRLKVHENGHVGFFNPDKNTSCLVLDQSVQQMIVRVQRWARDNTTQAQLISHLEVRGRDLDGKHGVYLVHRQPHETMAIETLSHALGDDALVAIAGHGEAPCQRFALGTKLYGYVPLDGFMQVNHGVNEQLRACLLRAADQRSIGRFVDLYCGSGNLSLPLLNSGRSGIAIESHVPSIRAAQQAAIEQALDGDAFLAGDAAPELDTFLSRGGRPDLIVSNPPRAGMKDALGAVIRAQPRHLALCYCNPESLAHDVAQLATRGYAVQEISLLNMFPHTRHVETLAWLTRD
jgi:23S rRNA (uracil1939-C5)-methyltransferase